MKKILKFNFYLSVFTAMTQFVLWTQFTESASALELDWSGQFWSEYNFIHGYSSDSAGTSDGRNGAGGYYVPGGGTQDASFMSLFLRMRPKVIVNDNIYIKSEWWVGDPIFGMFGNSLPYSTDQRQYYSSQSRGSVISAQRVWGEFVSDFGTFQIGRLPLQWGLGVVWNSGDTVWDRYQSTGDAIRWIAKFGSFTFAPSLIVTSAGNAIGGNCTYSGGACVPGQGGGGATDISLIVKYENAEEELDVGVNVLKRIASSNQDPSGGLVSPRSDNPGFGMNYTIYDFYGRKRLNRFTFGLEVPLAGGSVAGVDYRGYGIAAEVDWKPSEVWDFLLKAGRASGQPGFSGSTMDVVRSFYFNPNYHIGMIMFNYQLANFAGPQTLNNPSGSQTLLASPYNNPITNANYIALSTQIKPWEKWTLRPALVYALAAAGASANSSGFLNQWKGTVQTNNTGQNQGLNLGFEADLGITFQWDEYFTFALDNGIYFPGNFYAFSNTTTNNATNPVFGTSFRVGVNF